MSLYTLLYHSKAIMEYDRYALQALLTYARLNNQKQQITGILLYSNGYFIQVLEGEEDVVKTLYRQIQNDSRHIDVTTILQEPLKERLFPDWTMGYKEIAEEELRNIPGLNNLLLDGLASEDVPSDEVYQHIKQFSNQPDCFA